VAGRCERVLLSFVAFWRVRSIGATQFHDYNSRNVPRC
jgi:hypothetical protein